jgi:hypothetical protein
MGRFYSNRMMRNRHRLSAQVARCTWIPIRNFIMKSGCRSCALAAAFSSALGISRRKIIHTSTSIWTIPMRSSAPIAQLYSVSIQAWACTKPIRQTALTVIWTKKNRFYWLRFEHLLPAVPIGNQITTSPTAEWTAHSLGMRLRTISYVIGIASKALPPHLEYAPWAPASPLLPRPSALVPARWP